MKPEKEEKPTYLFMDDVLKLYWRRFNASSHDGKVSKIGWECKEDGYFAEHLAGVGQHMKKAHNIYIHRKSKRNRKILRLK